MKQASSPLNCPGTGTSWEARHARRGQRFEVIQAFNDADGDLHDPGECWTLIGTGFNKFEDMMWLGVRMADETEWLLPLDWRNGSQADVLEHWERYVRLGR